MRLLYRLILFAGVLVSLSFVAVLWTASSLSAFGTHQLPSAQRITLQKQTDDRHALVMGATEQAEFDGDFVAEHGWGNHQVTRVNVTTEPVVLSRLVGVYPFSLLLALQGRGAVTLAWLTDVVWVHRRRRRIASLPVSIQPTATCGCIAPARRAAQGGPTTSAG